MLFEEELLAKIEKLNSTFSMTDEWFEVVSRGAELKALMSEQLLSQRSRLLYGHNVGHGIETYDDTHRRHGDCVAIGMNIELALAVAGGLVDRKVWHRQQKILNKFNLTDRLPIGMEFSKIKDKMKLYKLYKNGEYLFVIPKKPGTIIRNNGDYYWHLTEKDLDILWPKALKLINQ
jgi:3-dehydroquinate synthase